MADRTSGLDARTGVFERANAAMVHQFTLVSTALMTIYSYWLATGRTWSVSHTDNNAWGADFFRNQADAILHGRLDVPFNNYPWTECFMNGGKCYGYFGVFPSVVRIPELILSGSNSVNYIPFYVALGIGLCFWASLDLFIRVAQGESLSFGRGDVVATRALILGTMLIGPASILVFLSEPAMYEEAFVWAVAMTMLMLNMVHRWCQEQNLTHLVVAILAGAAAANSRLTALPASVVLGAYLVYRRYPSRGRPEDQRLLRIEVALFSVPAIVYGAVMWIKFQSFTPPLEKLNYYNNQTMVDIRTANGGSYGGLRFLPTNLAQAFRPDSVSFSSAYPWVRFSVVDTSQAILVPPIIRKGIWVDHAVSITNSMFVQVALMVSASCISVKQYLKSRTLNLSLVLLTAAAAVFVPSLMTWGFTTRYTGDAYPLLMLGSIFGLVMLSRTPSMSKSLKIAFLNVGIAGAALSSFMWFVLQVNRW